MIYFGKTLPEVEIIYDPSAMEKVNRSNANFVKRLKDPNRKTILDGSMVATHKLSYATDDATDDAIVYPEVLELNGELFDFTNPKNKKTRRDAYISAVQHGDTIHMNEAEAKWFASDEYKKYFPNFDLY